MSTTQPLTNGTMPEANGTIPEANGHVIKPSLPDSPPSSQSTTTLDNLKTRIAAHYNHCSTYYHTLWGEHIHHGYFLSESDTKELAQIQLIKLLLEKAQVTRGSKVLDVGCGIGGTSRYLAQELACHVTGVTISAEQVKMARRLSAANGTVVGEESVKLGDGEVRFVEMDAERLGEHTALLPRGAFDVVWISEALSHFPHKDLFFRNAQALLRDGGKLVVADWFREDGLSTAQEEAYIHPIEHGMLLPPLCTAKQYVALAQEAGLRPFVDPLDISKQVAKTWDISVSLVASPSLWALAFTQGRDFVAFLQAFNAMRRGFANGTFRYAVMAFQK